MLSVKKKRWNKTPTDKEIVQAYYREESNAETLPYDAHFMTGEASVIMRNLLDGLEFAKKQAQEWLGKYHQIEQAFLNENSKEVIEDGK